MSDKQETIADIIAWLRKPREGENAYLTLWRDEIADRLDAAHKRECGDMAKMREVMSRVHDYLGELIRYNLVEDTPRASDLADDVYDAIHGSRSTEVPTKSMGPSMKNIDLSTVYAVCDDCARSLGFTRKDKAVGVWPDDCGVCHQHKPCTDLWHDWEPIKKGESK